MKTKKTKKRERKYFSFFSRFDVELRSPVTKAMLGALSRSRDIDPITASKLRQYCSREGKEHFTQLLQMQVTFIDLLVAFPVRF